MGAINAACSGVVCFPINGTSQLCVLEDSNGDGRFNMAIDKSVGVVGSVSPGDFKNAFLEAISANEAALEVQAAWDWLKENDPDFLALLERNPRFEELPSLGEYALRARNFTPRSALTKAGAPSNPDQYLHELIDILQLAKAAGLKAEQISLIISGGKKDDGQSGMPAQDIEQFYNNVLAILPEMRQELTEQQRASFKAEVSAFSEKINATDAGIPFRIAGSILVGVAVALMLLYASVSN